MKLILKQNSEMNQKLEERYHRLLKQQPDKIKQIPLSLIASYLSITLERPSSIRKKMKG